MMAQSYEVHALEEGGWRIEENGVRCFLFPGRDRAMLVDTGFGTGDLKQVVSGLTDLPIFLVNTHADRDHVGCNHQFAAPSMHPAEFERYQQNKDPVPTAVPLWEGDVIDLDSRRFQVLHIPGHTPGSIALLDEENRVLVSGDSVSACDMFLFGPGRNRMAYRASLQRLLTLRGRFHRIYPSHGPLPVEPEILETLLEEIERVIDGTAVGEPREVHGQPVVRYGAGAAGFLCSK